MPVSQWTQTLHDSPPKLLCIEPKKSSRNKRKRGLVQTSYNNLASTMQRAKDVQANLALEFSSFIKTMLHSHVASGFSLSLSRKFCDSHLPKHDATIVLEDENGKVFETKYLVAKGGLSGGWRAFSIAHKLVAGDVLVFHLVSPLKFKIYIIRSNGSDEVDCALGLLKFETHNAQGGTMGIAACKDGAKRLKPLLEGNPDGDDDNQQNGCGISDQSHKESDNIIPKRMPAHIEPKKSESNEREKVIVQSLCENPSSTMERAKAVQANLAPEFPSFVKHMVQSHVSRCFCLNLPKKFCNLHLPKHDATMVLEDEYGKVSESKYLARKVGLSGGWRGFSIAHKLVEGDVLVFHLVSPFKFKIYIIRSNGSDEVDCALGLFKFEAHNAQGDTIKYKDRSVGIVECKDGAKRLKPLLEGNPDGDDDNQKNIYGISYQSDKESDNIFPERKSSHIAPKKPESNEREKVIVQSLCENRSSTMERAKAVQANLAPEFPSFIKNMVQSHVSRCFCLSLPKKFCDLHLPKHDATMVLEDENGKVSESKYLARKVGLSGGWRGFSIAHKLVEGDVLVFHLVSPFKFKIYIIRSNDSVEVDCALGLLKLEARNSQADNMDVVALEDGTDDDDSQKISDHSDKDSGDISPEVLDGIRLSDSVIAFEEVRSIEDFEILVNGLVINSELSKYLQGKYYQLCCSQKAFLHENVLKGLNCKLVAGIISETINIADAIRASKITSSVNYFSIWAKTLIAFEGLGMNVGFLRARLDQLVNLATNANRYKNVREERDNAQGVLKILDAEILAAKQQVTRLDTEFDTIGFNYRKLELMFEGVARAPW